MEMHSRMRLKDVVTVCAAVLCLIVPASAEMYKIENPAANIYNPAARMNNPDPLSPPTQAVTQPVSSEPEIVPRPEKLTRAQPQLKPDIPLKSYNFKSVKTYVQFAKKAFVRDDYLEFISIAEDALRRIGSGTLKSSKKTQQRLEKFRHFGYALLDKN